MVSYCRYTYTGSILYTIYVGVFESRRGGSATSAKDPERMSSSRQRIVRSAIHNNYVANQRTLGVVTAGTSKRQLSANTSLEFPTAKRQSVITKGQSMGRALPVPDREEHRKTAAPVAPTRRPQGDDATPPELEVLIDNMAVARGALTIDEIELVRFQITTMMFGPNAEEMGPEFGFSYSGYSNTHLSVHCKSAASRDWLLSNIGQVNEAFSGANLRARIRPDIPVPHRVAAFFPMPKKVEESFLHGLLIRQNQRLKADRWDLRSCEFVQGKDAAHPMVGAGYWTRFELDDKGLATLKENGMKALFATTTVAFKVFGKQPAKEVTGEEEPTESNVGGAGAQAT